MLVRAEAVVLRTLAYQDHAAILTVYSAHEGRTDLIKKGRRPPVQTLALCEFVYRKKPGYELYTVRECAGTRVYRTLYDEPLKMMYGMYAAEVFLALVVEKEEANPPLFHRLRRFLIELDESITGLFGVTTCFLADLTAFAGYSPEGRVFNPKTGLWDETCGDEAGRWMARYFDPVPPAEPPKALRPKIWEAFLRFWELHVPEFRRPKSWDVFREFFE